MSERTTPKAWRGPAPAWVAGSTRILFDCRYTRLERHDGISRYGERLVGQIAKRHPVVMLISDERQLAMLPDLPWTLGPSPTSALEPLIATRAINRLVLLAPMDQRLLAASNKGSATSPDNPIASRFLYEANLAVAMEGFEQTRQIKPDSRSASIIDRYRSAIATAQIAG